MTSQTMQPIEWVDTHCHVYEETIPGGADGALQAARDAGVTTMIVIGTDATTTQQAIAIAACLLYTSPSPRDGLLSRMPSSA